MKMVCIPSRNQPNCICIDGTVGFGHKLLNCCDFENVRMTSNMMTQILALASRRGLASTHFLDELNRNKRSGPRFNRDIEEVHMALIMANQIISA